MNTSRFSIDLSAQKAKGRQLTNIARLYGLKRKWWGLEPDFMLRKRTLKVIYDVAVKSWTDWSRNL